jgi:hypothetical protein
MYVVSYGEVRSNPFRIAADVYRRHVWQPTVDSFLPIQMCHLRVNEPTASGTTPATSTTRGWRP